MNDGPLVKGQTLKSLLLFLQSKLSPAQVDQLLSSIDPEHQRQIKTGVLPTSTFPMALVNQLTVDGAAVSGTPLALFAKDAGRFSANEGLRGVYRLFARVLTTEALLSRAAAMWSAMNTAGKMEVLRQASGRALLRLSGYPSQPVMCLRINGWIEQLAEAAGASPTVTHSRCAARGAEACEWDISW
jgi:hypothetical protein